MERDAVKAEVKLAIEQGKPVIPIIVSPSHFVESSYWKETLSAYNWGIINPEAKSANIVESMRERIHRSVLDFDIDFDPTDRSHPILAFYNFRGGVGKTTLAAHTAARLSLLGKSVCMIDCDPQSNLSSIFLTRKALDNATAYSRNLIGMLEPARFGPNPQDPHDRVIMGGKMTPGLLGNAVMELRSQSEGLPRFSLVASAITASKYSTEIDERTRGRVFENFMNGVRLIQSQFDFVVLDCNPGYSLLSQHALQICSDVIAPLRPDRFTVNGLENLVPLLSNIAELNCKPGFNPGGQQLWTVLNGIPYNLLDTNDIEGQSAPAAELIRSFFFPDGAQHDLQRLLPALLDARIPHSDRLNPTGLAAAVAIDGIDPPHHLTEFDNNARFAALTRSFEQLARELIDKTGPTPSIRAVNTI